MTTSNAPTIKPILQIKDIQSDTCITDFIQLLLHNKDYLVFIFLALLGTFIKLYDNLNDWNLLDSISNPYKKYLPESLKFIMIIISTATFMIDSGSVYGILALHCLCLKNEEHGFDDSFFNIGILFVSLVAIFNVYNYGITNQNIIELLVLACIGYMETLLFREEISDVKITTRIFVVFILIMIVYLDITKYYSVFSQNVIQLFVCGIFYLGTDILMNIWLFIMEPQKYNKIKYNNNMKM